MIVTELTLAQKDGRRAHYAIKEISVHDQNDSTLRDVERAYNIEGEALQKVTGVKHPNLIQCLASITKSGRYFFIFPWANGGSLREFWNEQMRDPKLSPTLVRKVIEQLRGLAGALERLHNFKGTSSLSQKGRDNGNSALAGGIRHGDLKPENILRFTSPDDEGIGILKIADMGLAKHHYVATRLRATMTGTKYGTSQYEPPEVSAPSSMGQATSRLYDTWSMGCIILEMIIWLLRGKAALDNYNELIRGDTRSDLSCYETIGQRPNIEAIVRPQVTSCMEQLSRDPECAKNTALGDLLKVVQTMLLVVSLPPGDWALGEPNEYPQVSITSAPPTVQRAGPYRATAAALAKSLDKILGKGRENSRYLFSGRDRSGLLGKPFDVVGTVRPGAASLHPNAALKKRDPSAPGTRMRDNVSCANILPSTHSPES